MLFNDALSVEELTAKTIGETTKLPRAGKPVTFTGEATKKFIDTYKQEETARRQTTATRLPHLNRLEKFTLPALLAVGGLALGKYVYDKKSGKTSA